ncbi:hypothetical protein HOY34_11025 [Xinfangfangia sp. D13-10-4-6]|uniref:hypothetical protein n=1 Tax=Pseudogemmobacter hezensis TaxID=2737662 RepID=UPI001554E8C5|nr:hypothetical protein [Pseudogemmobacter hezensis]NPD15734.1 hypothetical protein [Pseudogemmobacter hezensis]
MAQMVPLSSDSPAVKHFEKVVGSTLQVVPSTCDGAFGQCYWNVDKFVEKFGGKAAYGWLVFQRWGILAEAVHHAVVEMPDGSLLDVTSSRVGTGDKIGFLRDDSVIPPRDFPIFIKSHFFLLKECQPAEVLIALTHRQNEIDAALVQAIKSAGMPFKLGENIELPEGDHVDELLAELEQNRTEMSATIRLLDLNAAAGL